jgi:hypothetical protein
VVVARVVSIKAAGRDARTGRFAEGNAGAAQVRLLPVDSDKVAPWMRDALRTAERRFRGMKQSGLLKQVGTRADGILRAACVADAVHDALAAHAVTLVDVREAREVLADAKGWAASAQKAWLKVFSFVGVRRGDGEKVDPLADLARELQSEGGDDE